MNIEPISIKNAKPNGVKGAVVIPAARWSCRGEKPAKEENTVKKSTSGGRRKRAEKRGRMCERVQGVGLGAARVYNLLTCFRWEPLRCPSHACWMSGETCEEPCVDKDPSVASLSTKTPPARRSVKPKSGCAGSHLHVRVTWWRKRTADDLRQKLMRPRLDTHGKKKKRTNRCSL